MISACNKHNGRFVARQTVIGKEELLLRMTTKSWLSRTSILISIVSIVVIIMNSWCWLILFFNVFNQSPDSFFGAPNKWSKALIEKRKKKWNVSQLEKKKMRHNDLDHDDHLHLSARAQKWLRSSNFSHFTNLREFFLLLSLILIIPNDERDMKQVKLKIEIK